MIRAFSYDDSMIMCYAFAASVLTYSHAQKYSLTGSHVCVEFLDLGLCVFAEILYCIPY